MEKSSQFKTANFTAIISDLHLCEAEPPHPKLKLWKKYKSREFFFDQTFAMWLRHIEDNAKHEKIELILNGDIFDFDSVTALPDDAPYKISWIEKKRSLFPEEPKSSFKIRKILAEHDVWVRALREFIGRGHRVIFVIGNHDLELHFPSVQQDVLNAICANEEDLTRVRFAPFFYISNQDTLVEHGNQYDPYCVCQNPINPMVQKFNRVEIRVPFGNLTTRYLINGMGFFNPHVDTTFIMSVKEYASFFVKYLARSQPLIMWTWFWGSMLAMTQSFVDRLLPALKDPLTIEDRIESIAENSNATPRMVREMREIAVDPAASNPFSLMKELWLDRALMVLITYLGIFQLFLMIKIAIDVSFFWMFIPMALFIPFFVFYSKSITSSIAKYKKPKENIMRMAGQITRTKRIIYGHTHEYRHETVGDVEHLNSGCWSPAFLDVECTKPYGKRTYIWLSPSEDGSRKAQLMEYKDGESVELFGRRRRPDREIEEAKKELEKTKTQSDAEYKASNS